MNIKDDLYEIHYEKDKKTIFFKGSLRLNDLARFDKIKRLMLDIYALKTSELNLDFIQLDFLNSAGISTLCNFIYEIKDLGKKPVRIFGNSNILWQKKSFENLKIIWEDIEIIFK
ncbi:MAG: hypothetical protein JW969_08125 [Spirochaetales bacterium]|nr:hypothetical protein [Spirochaetales bacterium]